MAKSIDNAPVYRDTENMIIWLLQIANKIPGSPALRRLGDRMVDEMMDALTALSIALESYSPEEKLECIDLFRLHFRTVKTIMRTLHEYSVRMPAKPGKDGAMVKPPVIVSHDQHRHYLDLCKDLAGQIKALRRSFVGMQQPPQD